jgi:hypothetical protein
MAQAESVEDGGDMTGNPTRDRRAAWLAVAAVAAQVLFVAGWLVGGAIEGHGYAPGRHDISDLGALTAHHAWLSQVTGGTAGALTIAFALFALRPIFGNVAWLGGTFADRPRQPQWRVLPDRLPGR